MRIGMILVRLYNDDGRYVMDAYYDKRMVTYDWAKSTVLVHANGIKIDPEDIVNNDEGRQFLHVKPKYMTFQKSSMHQLHYMI